MPAPSALSLALYDFAATPVDDEVSKVQSNLLSVSLSEKAGAPTSCHLLGALITYNRDLASWRPRPNPGKAESSVWTQVYSLSKLLLS